MLDGKLVRLRALEPSDAERLYKWINDREVTHYLMARYPYSLEFENGLPGRRQGKRLRRSDGWRSRPGTASIGNCGLHRSRPEDRHAGPASRSATRTTSRTATATTPS